MAAALNTKKAFLGVGLSFPPAADSHGAMAMTAYEEDIRQSLQIILATNPGERVMRPEFGAGLRDFVFEPADLSTLHRIEVRVREALIDFEPRVDVVEVLTSIDPGTRSTIYISITFRIRASNSLANLVYPFYLEEGQRT